jgi:hypothetical protein
MTIVERLQRAIDDEPFMLGGEHDLLRDALAEVERLRKELRRIAAIQTYSQRTWIMAVQAAREALKEDGR